jgi:hypothetical protein
MNYIGLKLHFNSEKFIFKAGCDYSSAFTVSHYKKRKDFQFFEQLGRQHKADFGLSYLTTSFICNTNIWIGDILTDETIADKHPLRIKKTSALKYYVTSDLTSVGTFCEKNSTSLKSLLSNCNGFPGIITELRAKSAISIETLSVLDHFFKFTRYETNDQLWQNVKSVISNYSCLLNIDEHVPVFKEKIDTLVKLNFASTAS